MKNLEVAAELERRAMNKLPNFKKEMGGGLDGMLEYTERIINNATPWQDYLIDELNQIIEDENLDFSNEKNKEALLEDIKPTMIKLLQEIVLP
jgi:hypothetical protein